MNFKRFQFLRAEARRKLCQSKERSSLFLGTSPLCDIERAAKEDSLTLAYLGDAVYSLYVREQVIATDITKVQVLHTLVTDLINAKSQAKALGVLEPLLDDTELSVMRRARNSQVNVPRSATVQEYRSSTAFEALVGFWYMSGQKERLLTMLDTVIQNLVSEKEQDHV